MINAGKSRHNEDQARAGLFFVHRPAEVKESPLDNMPTINLAYYKEKLKHLDIPLDIDVLVSSTTVIFNHSTRVI